MSIKHLSIRFLICISATISFLHADQLPLPLDPQYWCTVGDNGNTADSWTGLGAVAASYQIGKYEVTVGEYALFLNAVASKEDSHHLYNPEIKFLTRIESQLEDGTTLQTYITDNPNMPMNNVSCYSAMRYCNWLQNGIPTAAEGDDVVAASTEQGAYLFKTINGKDTVSFSDNALFALPTENQWMKAAYYKGNGLDAGYWGYPTKSFTLPNNDLKNLSNLANWSYNNKSDSGLTPVDKFFQTVGPYQTCDMAGNISEWVVRTIAPEAPLEVAARGGSFKSQYFYIRKNELQRTAVVNSTIPSTESPTIGFRIVLLLPAEGLLGTPSEPSSVSEQMPTLQSTAPSAEKTSTLSKALYGLLYGILGVIGGIAAAALLVVLITALGGEFVLDTGTVLVAKCLKSIFGFADLELDPKLLAWLIGAITGLVTGIYYGIH